MDDDKWFMVFWAASLVLSVVFLGVLVWAIITLVGWVVSQ